MPRNKLIQVRRGNASEWNSANPTLASGEIGYEIDTGKAKVGNSSQDWLSLNYAFGGGTSSVTSVNGQNGIVVLDTDDINEGANNLYYTSARFDLAFSSKTTSDLTEGSNLYFTNARAIAALTGQNISIFNNNSGYITSADFDTDTRDNILATTPTNGEANYATDYNRFYVGYNSSWYASSIPFHVDDQDGVNIGIQQDFVTNYNITYVTDIDVANCNLDSCIIRDTNRAEDRMIRSVTVGGVSQLQYYSDSAWRAILTGIQLQEDNNDILEFQPFGTEFWIEAHTGNSNKKGNNGRSVIQAYEVDIGTNPARRVYTGKYFDGTNFVEW